MRRSSLRLLRPLAFVTCCFPLLVSAKQQHVYTDSFPTNDEYDFSILDAYNVYGSPYGGFGRATRSRLAALPLHLPGVVGELTGEEDNGVYMEVRDGDGRLFACRVYHEDELESSSLTDSMFNTAKAKDPNAAEAVLSENSDVLAVGEPEKMEISENEAAESVNRNEKVEKPAATTNIIAMNKVLSMLRGVCTQIHMGWWSYEWCHDQGVAQFHIHVSEKDRNKLRLDGVTSLGKHESRKIDMFDTDNQANINDDTNSVQDGGEEPEIPKELGVIIDEFENGDICEETQLPRSTTVKLVCCSLETMRKFNNGVVYKGNLVKSNIAAIQRMEETETCNYYLEVCTPLLCEGLAEAFEDGLFAKEIPPKKKTEKKPVSRAPHEKKEGESIREILGSTLLNACLKVSDGGWWVYDVCHGRHVRQYHEADKFDAATGSHSRVPESVHMLGYYSKDDLEGFPNEEEILHVTNPSSDENIGTSKKNAAIKVSGGAYFEQEYTGGDLCDHSDVTDAAIVAGNVGEGGIERATTVRYFCGDEFVITRVNEDSTCHYLIDITIPDLCEHPFFKAPVVKKQVVKCLPVDESSGVRVSVT